MNNNKPGAKILPFYVVCDESYSMYGEPIKALNDALQDVHEEVGRNPVVCDKTRFGVIGFSDSAEVIQPLADLGDLTSLPVLTVKGGTNYSGAFRLLKHEIENDINQLKAAGARVFRPTVFFMSDGQPNDDEDEWQQALEDLAGDAAQYRPNVLAFGICEADAATIAKVGKTKAFQVDPAMSAAQALKEFAVGLTRSIISSASAASQDPQVVIPEVKGFNVLDTEEM